MNPLRELRKRKGITQTELGHVLHVQKSAISKYELGRATPSSDILKKLSDYFGVSINYILGAKFHKTEDQQPSTDLVNFLNQSEVIFNGITYKLNDEDRQKAITALERIFLDAKSRSPKNFSKT
ncbi:helix-turn-helix domain-containing protein [Propionispira raffinosivorans]|uniref:helix-turn-helix domain-containing protein n=1 Tax=Propionispira raffinosivorans TaxID=86959 RepID=UPI00035DE2C5|nr:helix-turn-helix transcriptional regulator [Propionispira raffinosivorans]